MNTRLLLLSFVFLLAAQNSFAEEDEDIGEISDDNFAAPPSMNSSSEREKSTTTNVGVVEKKADDVNKRKESNATGSFEKGEKIDGTVNGKPPSLSTVDKTKEKDTTTEAKIIDDKVAKHTTTADKKTTNHQSTENDANESAEGVKIVVAPNKSDKMDKTVTDKSNSIVDPSNVKNSDATEAAKKVISSTEQKENEKKDKKEAEVKKPVTSSETTHETTLRDITTVVTTVNVPLTEDSEEKKGAMVDGEGEAGSDEQEEPEGEQVKTEEKKVEEKKEEKKEEKEEEKRPYPKQPINAEYYSDSHFFSFFIFFIVLSAAGYLAYHNKRKIMALLIEGRSGKGGRVRYHRLANDDNFERNVIY